MDANPGRPIEAVIFDLGGVLLRNGRPSDAAAHYPGVDRERLEAAIMGPPGQDTDHPWHRLERGEITMAEYRELAREHMTALGITRAPSPPGSETTEEERRERPKRPPFEFVVNEAMVRLVRDLRAAAVPTAMLTNNVREIRPFWWDLADWPGLLDVIVDSHEVGVRKPNAAIYHLTLERLGGVPAERALFLDDLIGNVHGADRAGLQGVHVVDDGAEAIAHVRRAVGLG